MSRLVLVLFAVGLSYELNPNLKYFSVWELEDGSAPPRQYASWANFIFTTDNTTKLRDFHANGVGPNLFDVEPLLIQGSTTGITLKPNWREIWTTTRDKHLLPLLKSGVIMGVFFGDELTWNCLPYDSLLLVVNTARADLPKGTILYYNEAYPVFTKDICIHGKKIHYTKVPTGLNWVSVDYYPDEGTLAGTKQLFEESLYPKLGPNQSVLFVPPAYGAGSKPLAEQLCCNQLTRDGPNPNCHGNCTLAMLQWAVGVYKWAREDNRFVGLNPWHFTGKPKKGSRFEPGMEWMPAVLEKWKQIGKEITTGHLGDVGL